MGGKATAFGRDFAEADAGRYRNGVNLFVDDGRVLA